MLFGRKTASETAQEAPAASAPAQQAAEARPAPASQATIHRRLGQMLIEEGLVTSGQLEKALEEQARSGEFLGKVLVQQGAVTQAAVSSCLVKQCKIPHLSLLDYDISQEVLALVPEEVCRKHHLLPIDKLGRILTVAMVDPLDTEALDLIRQHCPDLKIKPILCNWEHYDSVASKVWNNTVGHVHTQHAVTAASLGLREMTAKTTDPFPTPLPPTKPPPTSSLSDSQINALQTSGVSAQEISNAVRENMRDAMRDAVHDAMNTIKPQAAPAAPGISGEEISSAIRGAMMDAVNTLAAQQHAPAPGPDMHELSAMLKQSMQEAVSAVAREFRAAAPVATGSSQAAPMPSPAPDMHELGDMLRTSMQEAVAAVAREMRPAPGAPSAPQMTPDQIASAIHESVGGAMQEALAVMVTQFKALAPRRDDSSSDALAVAVRESVREAMQATLSTQHEQGDRLAEIAKATLQSVQQTTQLIESTAVNKQTETDLVRGPQGRHASVSTFRGSASGTMDNDGKVVEALENNRPAEMMTFENFVPGNVNAFTFKVSQQIASHPGAEFNPLFLFGHVGAGKTHLISAIGNHILKTSPVARVGYVSASHFARRLKDAMGENALDAFREHYAHWDVLILDDIQFLAGRVEAQEEFFHIFNALHQQGRQIIIASDKAPDRLGLLEQRLISRFASGIVAELKAPEWEARMAILKQQAKQSGAKVPDQVLAVIAMRVADDVRKLTGSLRKVIAYAQLGGKELTVEMAEEILSHLSSVAAA